MRIVIADENIVVRKKLRQALEYLNHEVVSEAANGLHAYNKYVEYLPDMIFLSLDMPIYNGINALMRILEYNENACVIIMSQTDDTREIFKALDLGATHYLKKPIDDYQLNNMMSDVLSIMKRRENV